MNGILMVEDMVRMINSDMLRMKRTPGLFYFYRV
jgi:hypothetical protein